MDTNASELPEVLKSQCGFSCLTDICHYSFNEFRQQVSEHLNWSETRRLYDKAQQEQKENKLYETKILKRANPQLQNAVHLAITVPHAELRGYNDEFGNRASQYVAPGAVSSMFSPAAYLTELYRETRQLHAESSVYHLDKRRPDLQSMALSQSNMDSEISTLSLSNELLLEGIKAKTGLDSQSKVMEMLSTFRLSGATPYHDAYENVHKVIQLQDPTLEQLRAAPNVVGLMNPASLLGINASVSPELFNILTEEITEENAEELYKKNFGEVDPALMSTPAYLKKYYNLSDDEVRLFIGTASNFGQTKYLNNQLITPVPQSDGSIKVYRITREYTVNTSQLNEAGLFISKGDKYNLTYNFKDFWNSEYLAIRLNHSKELTRIPGAPQKNIKYSAEITLSNDDIRQPFQIYLRRVLPNDNFVHTAARFSIEEYNQYSFLLKLNKAIRLFRATGLPPTILENIVLSVNGELDIDAQALGKIFSVIYYMQHYKIDAETALILCNATISQRTTDDQISQFDRLFNTPPLNGQSFSTDGEKLNLNPGSADDWHKAVLKRAFSADDISLYRLLQISHRDNKDGYMINSLENLSSLYLARLLAETHQLSIDELDLLLVAIGETQSLSGIQDDDLSKLINKLDAVTKWLKARQWQVYQLFMMTTTRYDQTLTPEIRNLLDTVYNGLQGFDSTQGDLLKAMSPYIAATLQLPSENIAYSVLLWADKLQPGTGKMTAQKFWAWLQYQHNPNLPKPETTQEEAVQYCQSLSQLALIYRSSGLTESAFELFVTKPDVFGFPAGSAPAHDALSLMMLTHFADWVNAQGDKASPTLTAFAEKTLTAEKLADAMVLDANLLSQAYIQAKQHNQVTEENAFSNWISINIILQWISVSQQLNIAPQGVSALVALDYIPRIPGNALPTYSQWETSANILTAGLDSQQADSLHTFLDEARSAALSTYYIRQVASTAAAIQSRDDLYQYLLIDNQVSAAIKTTRIAEAIASIQLYVNRTLESAEENADSGVITRQFFTDWDKYNKRYSTWAGVSQLAYYPENYIDPTMRIGQTNMMDALLQQISQSQLNTDIVEDAFMSYLTSFEQVANLEVISAYHDNINDSTGLTYFIGLSETEAGEYYWRSVDHSKFGDGKFAANAWSEWSKIDCPINPYQGTIRPVMYKSRLYISWLEQKEITKPTGSNNQTTTEYRYDLKLSHIRYDGTWNTPLTFDVNDKINNLSLDKDKKGAPGLYCAGYQGEDTLLVMFYKKEDDINTYKSASMQGLYIFSDMSARDMETTQSNVYRDNSYVQFDTSNIRRVNNRYAEDYEIPSSVNSRKDYGWGYDNLSMVFNGRIPVIKYQASSNTLKVFLSPKLRVIHNGVEGRQRNQCNLMKKYGKLGDKFIIYKNLDVNPVNSSNNLLFYPVYLYSGNTSNLSQGRLLFHRDTNFSSDVQALIPDASRSLYKNNAAIQDDFAVDELNRPDDLKKYIFMTDNKVIATHVRGAQEINTTISPSKVKVTVKVGKTEKLFTADENVSSQPKPSLEEMYYQFNELEIDTSSLNFINNSASIDVTFTAQAEDGRQLGWESFSIPVTRKVHSGTALTLCHDDNGAQYMQWGVYRIRLNTLFARQLVSRATTGIDTILSMETQNIQEPQLGKGFYVTFKIPPYNQTVHGDTRGFKLYLKHVVDNNSHIIYSGQFGDTILSITLFIPLDDVPLNEGFIAKVYMTYEKSPSDDNWKGPHFITDDKGNITINPSSILTDFEDINILNGINTEPMDFSGANSLYFWELFYYTPMLVAQRLLHEQNFDETNRWLKYVWSPSGYIVGGNIQTYKWNVRPLLEDTSWNSDPLDSVDPDAVAQHDPMHYKVSTFMRTLDLLIARGDYAYRQLERDTLNEAKMWYIQALNLLGDKPYLSLTGDWSNPRLDQAADNTTKQAYAQAMTRLRQNEVRSQEIQVITANSLTDLFLPQVNEVMMNYWQTLAQRLYNLRHNLSIDGQPLSLPIFATPADPKALLSAAVATSQGGGNLPQVSIPLWRFPQMLENARSMVGQLMQFGSTLQSIIERQDAEALNALLQNQAAELILTNISIQDKTIEELDAEKAVLEKSRAGVQSRYDSYSKLYDENINAGEDRAMTLRATASGMTTAVQAARLAGAAADLVPNIFGFAAGGSRWGAIAEATGYVMEFSANVMNTEADKISQSEAYRRRRQEWEIQRNNAEAELKQIEAQFNSLAIRREAAVLQKGSLKTQQEQTQAQLAFLQRKFSNQALYNWLRGRLAAIYFQFYDLAMTRCLMAEMAYRWETNDESARFIKSGAWQGTYAGLMVGESLMLNLAQMEDAHLKQDQRALEVERTVSLAEVYADLSSKSFNLATKVAELVKEGKGSAGDGLNSLTFGTGTDTKTSLQASISLADLKISEDYPASLGTVRRIKQISVTLPALLGPYQDVQAVLSYGGDNNRLARGCKALAISRGMNDSGQFQLDFNDGKFLPFEGIAIDDKGALILSFPNATTRQQAMLQTLNDIILHIRYTILD
ncbi:toxin [Xenorhabdus khoisanae]|uniref:Toxin n=1 Tax=Xenorhabdus khoisanae TaxID=880157 RepID=A0A0J5FXR3_9GAMM|nr:neuraminidase-like domain-containing protein [Xenorhabdus khoisanae]KMJ46988.1 toxin [Xenorhabdus khoisanae]